MQHASQVPSSNFQFTKLISNLLIIDLNPEFPMTTPARRRKALSLISPWLRSQWAQKHSNGNQALCA